MRLTLFLFFIAFAQFSFNADAQKAPKSYHHQISLFSENDSYALDKIDRYYTNGIAIRFATSLKSKGTTKRVLGAEVGQSIYTPYSIKKNYLSYLDRPYTGFLYAKGGLTYLHAGENILSWNILAGVIGKAAKGQEVQEAIHKTFRFLRPRGWETQLKSELGINLQGSYHYHLLNGRNNKAKRFDAFAVTNATVGTTFNCISEGILLRFGRINPSYESSWWDGVLSPERTASKQELFLYFQPTIEYQLFNATMQGGVFTKDNPYTTSIRPFVYRHMFGGMFSRGRSQIQLGYTFTTKEAKTMVVNSTYGTIAFGLRL